MTTSLSERELQILRLVAEGFSNRQIAGQLDISENTVKVHVRNIFGKIQVASRTEASMYAVRNGLIADVAPVELVHVEGDVPADVLNQPPAAPKWVLPRWLVVIGLLVLVSVIGGGVWWSMRDVYQVRPIAQPTDTQRWRQLAALPVSAPGVQLVTVAGRLYALGGALDQTVMLYDASQDAWMVSDELPLQTPYSLSWSDATGVWLIESTTQAIWVWDGQAWQRRGVIPDVVSPVAIARVAGTLLVLDVRGTVWVPTDDALDRWTAYTLPVSQLVAPRLVVVDDVLLLFGDGQIVWKSLDQGRSWFRDGELTRPWQGGPAVPVLSAIMLIRDGQQSLYTLTVGEGGAQAVPVSIGSDATLTIWQTMIVIGSLDGSQIDTYQFVYQSFMPMMR
jgi:DNA-binding CsgD family transcriptional regulator